MDKLQNSPKFKSSLNKDSILSNRTIDKKNHCRFMSLQQYKSKLEQNHLPHLCDKMPKIKENEMNKSNFFHKVLLTRTTNLNSTISNNSTITTPEFNLKNFEAKIKTSANNTIDIENNDVEVDALISFYHTNGDKRKMKFKKENTFSLTKKELFQKYKIKKNLDKTEKDSIINIMESDTFHKSKTKYQSIVIREEFFKSPLSSLKKVKINKNIRDKVVNIAFHKQAKSYLEEFYKVVKEKNKIKNMPEVRKSDPSNIQSDSSDRKKFVRQGTLNSIINNPIKGSKSISNRLKMSREQFFKTSLFFQGKHITRSKNKPKSRSQAGCLIYENILLIFGGLNSQGLDDLWLCDIGDNYSWIQVHPIGIVPSGRYGHSAVIFKKDVYFYGGIACEGGTPSEDILIFCISENKWKFEKCSNTRFMSYRRNHIAHIIGNTMIVFGGIDLDDEILGDLWSLDLNTMEWQKLQEKGDKPGKIAFAASALVLISEKSRFSNINVFNLPEYANIPKKIKIEGIYMFGGIDADSNVKSDLRILKIGVKPLEWIIPKTDGSQPQARSSASMNFYEKLNILVLFGGKNDLINAYFNDVYVLDLENFIWYKVAVCDDFAPKRADHCAAVYENKLIYFGGMNNNQFIGSDIYAINMDYGENKNTRENQLTLSKNENNFVNSEKLITDF